MHEAAVLGVMSGMFEFRSSFSESCVLGGAAFRGPGEPGRDEARLSGCGPPALVGSETLFCFEVARNFESLLLARAPMMQRRELHLRCVCPLGKPAPGINGVLIYALVIQEGCSQ